jgi:hypothetical protein
MSLSERIRADSEAAPWVIEEVMEMEAEIERLTRKVEYLSKDRCLFCLGSVCNNCDEWSG